MTTLTKQLKESKLKHYPALKALLRKNKFYLSSTGRYACCYTKKNTAYVIKVFEKNIDLAYWSYLKRIKKSNNPYTPRIYNVIERVINRRKYIIVILEKLICWKNIKEEELSEILIEHFDYKNIYDSYEVLIEDYEPTNKMLKRLWKTLLDICENLQCIFDNHKYNIMFRQENNNYFPVFIDPLYEGDF